MAPFKNLILSNYFPGPHTCPTITLYQTAQAVMYVRQEATGGLLDAQAE